MALGAWHRPFVQGWLEPLLTGGQLHWEGVWGLSKLCRPHRPSLQDCFKRRWEAWAILQHVTACLLSGFLARTRCMMQDNKIFTPLCCWQIETTYVCKLFAVLSPSGMYHASTKQNTSLVQGLSEYCFQQAPCMQTYLYIANRPAAALGMINNSFWGKQGISSTRKM